MCNLVCSLSFWWSCYKFRSWTNRMSIEAIGLVCKLKSCNSVIVHSTTFTSPVVYNGVFRGVWQKLTGPLGPTRDPCSCNPFDKNTNFWLEPFVINSINDCFSCKKINYGKQYAGLMWRGGGLEIWAHLMWYYKCECEFVCLLLFHAHIIKPV